MVVIGAGLSGAGATWSLAQRNIPTLLLDARGVSGGASGRNGGFLGGATWLQMPVMLLKMEASHALQVIKLKMANLAWIRDFVEKHQVDADLDTGVDGLSYYATEEDFKKAVGWWQHGEQDRLQATFLAGLRMHSHTDAPCVCSSTPRAAQALWRAHHGGGGGDARAP